MPPKSGLLGTLGVIALGVGLGGSGGQGHAAVTDTEQLCRLIESMPNAQSFQANPQAMDALRNPFNACHGVAIGKWASLEQQGDLGPPTSTGSIGYGFQ